MSIHAVAVVPAYRPDEQIFSVVASLKDAGFSRIVAVDDGNGEACAGLFARLSADPAVTVCTHSVNQGKGRAVKTAFNLILKEFPGCAAVTVDCDGQLSAADARRAAELAEERPDALILGCRDLKHTPNVPAPNRFGNSASRITIRLMTGIPYQDTQCGLRAYPPALMRRLVTLPGERFDFENNTLLAVCRERIPVVEFPIRVVYLPEGAYTTTFRRIRDSVIVYRNLLSFLSAPFFSFLGASLLALLIGAGVPSPLRCGLAFFGAGLFAAGLTGFFVPRRAAFLIGASLLASAQGAAAFGLASAGLNPALCWLVLLLPSLAALFWTYRRLGFGPRPKLTRR
ncbi:MAG: glycosyltransferase [Oscillospiraceae bacterium]|nr:glycosyltransferase [Oscillospiraceae bacterium]